MELVLEAGLTPTPLFLIAAKSMTIKFASDFTWLKLESSPYFMESDLYYSSTKGSTGAPSASLNGCCFYSTVMEVSVMVQIISQLDYWFYFITLSYFYCSLIRWCCLFHLAFYSLPPT